MEIAFGGGDAGVANHLLNFGDGGAASLQIGGKTVAEGVWIKIVVPGTMKSFFETFADRVDRKMRASTFARPEIVGNVGGVNVTAQFPFSGLGNINLARLVAFADKIDAATSKIGEFEIGKLGDA